VRHRKKNRLRWPYPELPEYREWSSNRMGSFTTKLCEMLQRAGADFMAPDDSGQIQ
jgi:hypothetical protein